MYNKKLYTIGLTGGICSGKSTLKNFFLQYQNIKFSNFDDFTANLYLKNNTLKEKLIKFFGQEILKNNEIDKKVLGTIVFKDKEKMRWLKSVVSPELKNMYFDFKNELELKNTMYDILVVEGPTIIESNFQVITNLNLEQF